MTGVYWGIRQILSANECAAIGQLQCIWFNMIFAKAGNYTLRDTGHRRIRSPVYRTSRTWLSTTARPVVCLETSARTSSVYLYRIRTMLVLSRTLFCHYSIPRVLEDQAPLQSWTDSEPVATKPKTYSSVGQRNDDIQNACTGCRPFWVIATRVKTRMSPISAISEFSTHNEADDECLYNMPQEKGALSGDCIWSALTVPGKMRPFKEPAMLELCQSQDRVQVGQPLPGHLRRQLAG